MSMLDLSAVRWRKSSHSTGQGGECVEVAGLTGRIAVRDSKDPAGPVLTFGPAAFGAFLDQVRQSGER